MSLDAQVLPVQGFFPLIALTLWSSAVLAEPAILSDENYVGAWECGPTTMHGANFDLVVTARMVNRADHTSTTTSTSIITPHGAAPITNVDESVDTWKIEGDLITTQTVSWRFVSSTDPTLTVEEGQSILDKQRDTKSTYLARVLSADRDTIRTIPHNSLYAEAVVESVCKRTADAPSP
jgi:hypothetical protein